MAYVPPHRRTGSRCRPSAANRAASTVSSLARVDEDSSSQSEVASQIASTSLHSALRSDHLMTSTVVSSSDAVDTPGLVFHEGVPPERVVELRHLRSSSPEHSEITPDDSVSVALAGGSRSVGAEDSGGAHGTHGTDIVDNERGGSSYQSQSQALLGSHRLPVASLNETQVASLLRSLGLGKYAAKCLQLPLRGCDLLHCTADDLEAAGISFRPHRLSLLDEVSKLAVDGVPSSMLASAEDDGMSAASSTPTWIHQAQAHLDASTTMLSPPTQPTATVELSVPTSSSSPAALQSSPSQPRAPSPVQSECHTLVQALTKMKLSS